MQYSTTHRTNNMSDLAPQIGASGIVKIFSGSAPANCGTADTGTLLATYALNGTSAGAGAAGVFTFNGTTTATASSSSNPISGTFVAAGTAGYFRVYPSAATTTNAVIQGTVTVTGGGGDLQIGNVSIASGITLQIFSWTITAYGA